MCASQAGYRRSEPLTCRRSCSVRASRVARTEPVRTVPEREESPLSALLSRKARRTAGYVTVLGVAPVLLTVASAESASAHGSMEDPVSRVSACFAEGPESPRSAACKAAVEASGAQAFYDWNEVNIPDAAGKHRDIIPDGKLCSAGREKYQGLDLPRTDWPSSELTSGAHAFTFRATAPHKGTFELYLTKDGYDASKPLKWSDLESKPFAEATDPTLSDGSYTIEGDVPERTGRHLVYAVWQRSDSPEAFYSCSDVTFGGGSSGPASTKSSGSEGSSQSEAQAPTDGQIAEGTERSTVDHDGHGGKPHSEAAGHAGHGAAPQGGAEEARLAETGGENDTALVAAGGAAVLVAGAAVVLATVRRKALGRHRG